MDTLLFEAYNRFMIKVITFDLDGVYFPNGKANFKKAILALGVGEEEFSRVFARSPEMNSEYKLGKITDEEFWTWAGKEWNVPLSWQQLTDLLVSGYDVDTRIVDVIHTVRAKGYKTAICTSNFPARIDGLQERFKFLDDFDIKVISYEVGYNKPDQQIYQKLVEFSQVPPEEIVFADDNLESVENSRSVGITTFLYESFDTYIEQLRSVGVEL